MSNFTLEIKFTMPIPKWSDASIPMRQCSERIKADTQRNIRLQKSPDGAPFAPLSKDTIRKKKRSGLGFAGNPERALFAKGIMYRGIHVYRLAKNTFSVGVMARGFPPRDLLAIIHQEQGVISKRGRIARPFLGISKNTEIWINARMQRWANRALRNAPIKTLKIKT